MKTNSQSLLVLATCVLSTTGAFGANKFTGTCTGETITRYNTSDVYCCQTTTSADFTSDGYARGFAEPDGSVTCCLNIECPNGANTTAEDGGRYCADKFTANGLFYQYYGGGESGDIYAHRKCVRANNQNELKCDVASMFRQDTDGSNGERRHWVCRACGSLTNNSSLPSNSYSNWEWTYKDSTTQNKGNRAPTDCTAKAYRTEIGCTDDRVLDYYNIKSWVNSYQSTWGHLKYGSFTAKAGYKKDTNAGTCPACDDKEISNGGDITSCTPCPYYSGGLNNSVIWPDNYSYATCDPVLMVFDSSNTAQYAPQGNKSGNTCIAGTNVTDTTGVYSTGSCAISADALSQSVTLTFDFTSNNAGYCGKTFSDFVSTVCGGLLGTTGSSLGGCMTALTPTGPGSVSGWTNSNLGTTSGYAVQDGTFLVTFSSLYYAQTFIFRLVKENSFSPRCMVACSD